MNSVGGPLLAVLARMPQPGQVKTRLARDLGPLQAAQLYAAFTQDLLEELQGGPWTLVVAADPQWPLSDYREWLPQANDYWTQGRGDLGQRLHRVVQRAFGLGFAPVVLVGSDMPHLSRERVQRAIDDCAPGGADVVLGPARDGGYYLLALAQELALFEGISWSGPQVLSQTLQLVERLGKTSSLLSSESDVDTLSQWQELIDRIRSGEIQAERIPRTASLALTGFCPQRAKVDP